jgi:hypothetical protein
MARYADAIEWVAYNDEPDDDDASSIAEYITTALVADVFGKDADAVAHDIARQRLRDRQKEE